MFSLADGLYSDAMSYEHGHYVIVTPKGCCLLRFWDATFG